MIKYISIFWFVLKCLLVARKDNLTGFSTGSTGRSKNLDPTGNPIGLSTRPVPVDPTGFHLWCTLRKQCRYCIIVSTLQFNCSIDVTVDDLDRFDLLVFFCLFF